MRTGGPEAFRLQHWRALRRAFGIDQTTRDGGRQVGWVAHAYCRAGEIVASRRCLLSRHQAASDQPWGEAARSPAGAGYQYEIRLGDPFFLDAETGYDDAVRACATRNPGHPVLNERLRSDSALLRVTTLIHEAIHWYHDDNGRHRDAAGYHASLGMLRDPYNYEFFILEAICFPPQDLVDDHRRAPEAALPPRPDGLRGRGRAPGALGRSVV